VSQEQNNEETANVEEIVDVNDSSVIESIRQVRIEKAKNLKEVGMDPYTAGPFEKISATEALEAAEGTQVSIAGRVMSSRTMGNVTFGHLHDESGEIQFMLSKKAVEEPDLPEPAYKFILKNLDVGDFVYIEGERIVTKVGEPTVLAKRFRIITKSLRALPEKHAGLKNEDVLLRKRYLDILQNREVQEMIYKKAIFWKSTRRFLEDKGFIEVQTPILEHTTGGGDAKPFVTHHNFLDAEVKLRISTGELWQKKLLVGGLEKVFEIGRQFRNENQSREHANDYDQMEFYWAYANYGLGMDLVEELFKHIAQETFGTLTFEMNRFGKTHKVDLGAEWKRYDFCETIKEIAGVDINTDSDENLQQFVDKSGADHEGPAVSRPKLIDRIWKVCRREITGPGFLVNELYELSPLAKRSPDSDTTVERFHVLIGGSELGNGYSELNDPVDQLERFEAQQQMRDSGDDEAQEANYDFVEALEYGMPPAVGFGMSERVFSFFMDKSLRECQIFPLLRKE